MKNSAPGNFSWNQMVIAGKVETLFTVLVHRKRNVEVFSRFSESEIKSNSGVSEPVCRDTLVRCDRLSGVSGELTISPIFLDVDWMDVFSG